MKTLRLFLVVASSFVVGACASGSNSTSSQQANQAQLGANSFQPPPGMAGVYVFQEGSLVQADNSHRIFLDGQALGIVSSSSYVYQPVSPGQHTVTCENSKVTITAQAGQNYFVREKTHLDNGGQILNSTLSMESSAKAIPLIKELQSLE